MVDLIEHGGELSDGQKSKSAYRKYRWSKNPNPTGNSSTISTEALDSSACVFYDYDPSSVVAKNKARICICLEVYRD